jgi:hypothetical protein
MLFIVTSYILKNQTSSKMLRQGCGIGKYNYKQIIITKLRKTLPYSHIVDILIRLNRGRIFKN